LINRQTSQNNYQIREDPDQPSSVGYTPEKEVALRQVYERQQPNNVSYTTNIDGPRAKPLAPDHHLTLRESMHTMAQLGRVFGTHDESPGMNLMARIPRRDSYIIL